MPQSEPAMVSIRGLSKRFGDTVALDALDLEVRRGEVFGLLGPNGAGKSTLVRTLSTLSHPDSGTVLVDGMDVVRQAQSVRERIGIVGQSTALDELMSGCANLELFGRLSRLSRSAARSRAKDLLEQFGLTDSGDRAVTGYSGGMRRRLDIAASFILAPSVLFLDEPTTGLDPRGRADVWDAITAVVAAGTTVLITTQYLEEADRVADRIAVIDHGRLVAEGTPDQLKADYGGDVVEVVLAPAVDVDVATRIVEAAVEGESTLDEERNTISAPVSGRVRGLIRVVEALDTAGIDAEDVTLRRVTLDEVFLRVTGTNSTTDTLEVAR